MKTCVPDPGISRTGASYISHNICGCNYLCLPVIPASSTQVYEYILTPNSSPRCKKQTVRAMLASASCTVTITANDSKKTRPSESYRAHSGTNMKENQVETYYIYIINIVPQAWYLVSSSMNFWRCPESNSQISQCTCLISDNTLFRTEMCTFLFWTVRCRKWDQALMARYLNQWWALTITCPEPFRNKDRPLPGYGLTLWI